MFDEFLKSCHMEDEIKPSKKRVQKNIAALNSLIETEEGTVTKRRFGLEPLLIAAVMTVISLSLVTAAYAATQNSAINFVMGGRAVEGECYDYVDQKGFRHISFSAELPIYVENFVVIYDIDAPKGESVRVITEETDPDFIEKLRSYLESLNDHHPADPEEFGLVFKDSEFCTYTWMYSPGHWGGGELCGNFRYLEAADGKSPHLSEEYSNFDHKKGTKIFRETFYYYVGL